MVYNEYAPCPQIAPYVRCIWTLQAGGGAPGMVHREKILPDGNMELLFHYGDRYRQYSRNETHTLQPTSFLHGQMKGYIEIGATGSTRLIAARFYPHGLAAFTRMPVHELTEQVVDVAALFGHAAAGMEEQLGNARDDAARVALINHFLASRLRAPTARMKAMAWAVNAIIAANGNSPIGRLAAEAHMSERQFERVFQGHVGLSAKALSRITRFHHSIKAAQHGRQVALTQLALENGYYDQAHFIRDFREFSGVTPAQYFSEIHPMSDLFTGA